MIILLTVQKELIYDLIDKIKNDTNNTNLNKINDKMENIENKEFGKLFLLPQWEP